MSAINTIAQHLSKQRARSIAVFNNMTSCAYRGKNNTTCAVGCLIPDEMYTSDMEQNPFVNLKLNFPELHTYLADTHFGGDLREAELVLTIAQNFHDGDVYDRLLQSAKKNNWSDEELAEVIADHLLLKVADSKNSNLVMQA